MRKTQIICTMGPATDDVEVLKRMIEAGMNVARFNFSHGSHEEHLKRIELVREARDQLSKPVALMLDTKGPEIRTGTYSCGKITLNEGQRFTLTTREVDGNETQVSVNYAGLPKDVSVGTRILIDDGLVAMRVEEINDCDIVCIVLNKGTLSSRKSINIPGLSLNMPYISERDRADILFGIEHKVDYIAASFCRNADDMRQLRALLNENGGKDIGIIAKIENKEGVDNLSEILKSVEGIMVARGDLGVEVPFEQLPQIQKHLIKEATRHSKVVVTATQMLESMAQNPRPTRAEVSDVANAVYDGTSAIMLSGETSVGKYPVETVAAMSRIAETAEETIDYEQRRLSRGEFKYMELEGDAKTNAIAHAVCSTSNDLDAKCIVAFTESGSTARAVSGRRPGKNIIAPTPKVDTYHRMAMYWGITPCVVRRPVSSADLYTQAVGAATRHVGAGVDDIIVVTAGMPVGRVTYTNTMRVIEITDEYLNMAFEENI